MRTNDMMSRRPGAAIVRRALLPVLALGLVLSACDDFLTTEPKAQLTTAAFFETEAQAIQATNATYSMLRHWEVHVFSFIGLTDIVSDDATKGSVPADAGFLLDIDDLNFDPGNIAFSTVWGGYYKGIYRANVAIQGIPSVSGSETLKARLIGENKFLRAYYYFFLVRAFGGVPLITSPLAPAEFTQTRATAEAVYAQIEQDLLDAIAALPEKSQYPAADLGRATRGAARALLAKVYLFQGKYAEALDRAQAVIASGEYSLADDYAQVFTEEGANGPGSIFEVQLLALAGGNASPAGASSQYSEVQGVRGTPNLGWGFNTPAPELEASYEPGDPRLQATILYPWEMLPDGSGQVVHLNPSMPNNRYNQKPFRSTLLPGGNNNTASNIRILRYADVLLIAAEAAQRTGNGAQAQTYLNLVRARARGGATVTLGLHPERLAETIATGVLGAAAGPSRVMVRYVNPASAAHDAGLRSFESEHDNDISPVPVRVTNLHLIEAVDGVPVTTPAEYRAQVQTKSPGTMVTLTGRVVTHPAGGDATFSPLAVSVQAQALLPDVTAAGQALLEAIWSERRHELAMEQHRWFDIVRQGRAPELMAVAGKTFITGTHERFPIPAGEVAVAGLQQNPGYN